MILGGGRGEIYIVDKDGYHIGLLVDKLFCFGLSPCKGLKVRYNNDDNKANQH